MPNRRSPENESKVNMKGMHLFVKSLGPSDAPNLIILHGLLGTSDNWITLGKQFASRFHVHLIDQRNHGRSAHNDDHSYESMAADLLLFMDEQGIAKASIIGHSMGGKTAMMFAHHHPDRMEKLVVADMAARAYAPHHQPIFEALMTAPVQEAESRETIETHLMSHLNDSTVVAFLMKNLRREAVGGFHWRPNVHVLHRKLAEVVGKVPLAVHTIPTLVIYGGQSNYVNPADLIEFEQTCLQLETHEISQAGHWLHASHPAEFFEVVEHFLLA